MSMRFLPDQPITQCSQDVLGFSAFVDTIVESLQNTSCPFVFGILGEWGSGKTSIMRMIEEKMAHSLEKLSTPNQVQVPIWFDAWLYENETNVIYPLLHVIHKNLIEQLCEHSKNKEKLKQLEKQFSRVVKGSFLALSDLGLRAATHLFIGETMKLKEVQEILELVEKDPRLSLLEAAMGKWANEVGELRQAFEELLGCYAEEISLAKAVDAKYIRFVIFIDDLDRCLPETVVRILESIKNFLNSSNTIFVLGINPRVVYQGIRSKYPSLDVDGREYLEKIINYSYFVPEPGGQLAAAFAQKGLENLNLGVDSSEGMKDAFAKFGKVIQSSRFSNPRKIKRILNRYLLWLNGNPSDTFSRANIARLIVIAEYFPALFSVFLSQAPNSNGVPKDLLDLNLHELEQKYGVAIGPFRQVALMSDLFNFEEGRALKEFHEHVKEVLAITNSV